MYKKSKLSWMKHLDFTVVDLIALSVAYFVSVFFRFGINNGFFRSGMYLQLWLTVMLIYFLVSMFGNAYKNILRRDRYQELRAVLVQTAFTFLLFIIYLYFTKQAFIFSRIVTVQTAILTAIFAYGGRIVWKRIIRLHMLNNVNLPHLLVVADRETAERIIRTMHKRRYNVFYIAGVVVTDEDLTGGEIEHVPVVCCMHQLKKYVLNEVVDEVFLSMDNQDERTELINYFLEAGITVHINLLSSNEALPNGMVEKIGGNMVLTTSSSVATSWKLTIKRLMDIVGGIIGIIITGILCIFIGPKIKKADPGPIFFSQVRIGKNGRPFKIYKFRSMYLDAEERKKDLMKNNEMDGLMFKMENDPRILPGIGQKIRSSSLDEFPQFWNVLKGDMSLVGTRPPTVDEFAHYDAHHKMRLSFKPGITGMWQVSGRSDITDFEEIVNLDNEYIRNWNLRLDIKILFKTIGVVLNKRGAK